MTADRKQQRKEFRKNINPPVKQGDNVVGGGCLMLLFPALLLFMNRQVTLTPKEWPGFFHGWEVTDGTGHHLGLIGEYEHPLRYRAYGVRLSLDGGPVAAEHEFKSRDEAEAWIVDGFPGADS